MTVLAEPAVAVYADDLRDTRHLKARSARLFTLGDAARMLREAIADRSYQQQTRLGSAVAKYLAWKRLSASARTLEIYEGYLARLCIALAELDPPVDEVTPDMLLHGLSEHARPSLKIVRTSYSDFFTWACRWGHCDRNPVDLLPKMPDPPQKVYDVFTQAEQAQLVKATDALILPRVQRLRVLCLVDLGVRKDEARGLRPTDFDPVAKVVVVRGKGGKERVVPFSDELWRAFVQYRNHPIPKVRMVDERGAYREDRLPADDDYLFFPCGADKQGRVTWTDPGRQLSKRGMHAWWQEHVAPAAGIKYRSMHMNRHTVGTDLATAEADAFTIRDWLGHADLSTTQVYVHNSRSRLNRGRDQLDEFRHGRKGA